MICKLRIGLKCCALQNGSRSFVHTFIQTLLYKWNVKNHFGFAVQFFLLISDSLGGVVYVFQFQFKLELLKLAYPYKHETMEASSLAS